MLTSLKAYIMILFYLVNKHLTSRHLSPGSSGKTFQNDKNVCITRCISSSYTGTPLPTWRTFLGPNKCHTASSGYLWFSRVVFPTYKYMCINVVPSKDQVPIFPRPWPQTVCICHVLAENLEANLEGWFAACSYHISAAQYVDTGGYGSMRALLVYPWRTEPGQRHHTDHVRVLRGQSALLLVLSINLYSNIPDKQTN